MQELRTEPQGQVVIQEEVVVQKSSKKRSKRGKLLIIKFALQSITKTGPLEYGSFFFRFCSIEYVIKFVKRKAISSFLILTVFQGHCTRKSGTKVKKILFLRFLTFRKRNHGDSKKFFKFFIKSFSAAQPQEVVDVNEDNFITRIASINELQPEYVAFITEFIGRANSDQYEFHSVKEQVQTLQFQLREKEDLVKTKDQELSKSRKELNATKAGIAETLRLQKDLQEQKGLSLKLQNQVAEAQKTATQRNGELEKLRKELFDAKARLQAANEHARESQNLKVEIAKLKTQATPSEVDNKKVADLEARLKSSEDALVNARRSVSTLEAEKSTLVDRERRICAELDELQREISQLSSIRIEKENIAQAAVPSEDEEKLRAEIEDLQKKNEACNASINKLNIELRKAFNDGYEFKQESIELKKQLEQSKEEQESLLKKLDIAEKKLTDFSGYYDNASTELRQLKNELHSLELEKK